MFNFLKKDFLLGVGIGLIISAVLISFFSPVELTDEEIIAKAAKLGMVLPNEGSSKTAASPVKAQDKTQDKAPVKETVESKPPLQQPTGEISKVQITVTSGMGSETIARILEEKGVVKDRDEFLDVVTAHKAHTRFRNGTFSLPVGGDMDDIVKILTGK
ncbi:MAG: hypothetical protein CVV03_02335 [Firmicutes bacterium HGW-Firmicutes-8]|nr:MAG: hypothetical protein CVV03_02335 [Firmicutes bacterium HGW-Firmicutes-8]